MADDMDGNVVVQTKTTYGVPALPDTGISKELIKAIAEEIGRGTVAYVEVMYPEAIKAASSTFKLSLRNHIHNEIVSIAELHDEPAIRSRLAKDAAFRKEWVGMYRKMRGRKRGAA